MTSVLAPATPAAAPALPDFDAAQAQVESLGVLLEEEFEALKSRSFERLEALQAAKVALLESLQSAASQVAGLPERPARWLAVVEALDATREAWRRNEILVARQLDVVRSTLRAMQSADGTASVDLYDRLGQMARRGGHRLYSEA